MKTKIPFQIELKKTVLSILVVFLLGGIVILIFLPQSSNALSIFSVFLMFFPMHFFGSVMRAKKEWNNSKLMITMCLLISSVCFALSLIAFLRKPVGEITYEFRAEKYGAIAFLIIGIVYLFIPAVVAVWNRRRKKSLQDGLQGGQTDIKEAKR